MILNAGAAGSRCSSSSCQLQLIQCTPQENAGDAGSGCRMLVPLGVGAALALAPVLEANPVHTSRVVGFIR
uniref:Uncharacterized protein n=1 Tax=Physcomitrium patens TaxID=3218 RepID=A0A2K1L9R0_PHYPA|nr:hypothetical protein PHYPA_001193 [Physcomitrium patens]